MHRFRDVLNRLLAKVFIAKRQLVPDVFVDAPGDVDAARISEALQPGRNVHSVTIDLLAVNHHVAEIDAYAELHPAPWRQILVLSFEGFLKLDGAIHCLQHAGKLGQDTVTRRVNKTTAMIPG